MFSIVFRLFVCLFVFGAKYSRASNKHEVVQSDAPRHTHTHSASLWVDKYRPSSLDKLQYHLAMASRLKRLVCQRCLGANAM